MIVAECRAAEEAGTRAHTTANVGGAAVEALWSPVSSSLKAFNGGILGVITRFQKVCLYNTLSSYPFASDITYMLRFKMYDITHTFSTVVRF
jgi:hypothetical protein